MDIEMPITILNIIMTLHYEQIMAHNAFGFGMIGSRLWSINK